MGWFGPTVIAQLFIGHLPRKLNNGKGMLFPVEQAFVGRDEKRATLKTPAWEANSLPPYPQRVYGRTSQPKFLGWIDYQIGPARFVRAWSSAIN